ncbi:hypothetical protein V499_06331 [Pseudogymnoascus sp. VKM F-103]|nr:hypothetical protein V499_06331 [Pseudogymnoascus sp. VKM F-103]
MQHHQHGKEKKKAIQKLASSACCAAFPPIHAGAVTAVLYCTVQPASSSSTSKQQLRGAHARTPAPTQAAASQGPSRRHAHSPYNLALKSLKRRQHLTPVVLPADHPDLPDQNSVDAVTSGHLGDFLYTWCRPRAV